MIQKAIKRLSLRALIINDELGEPTAEGRATRAIVQELQGRGVDVVEAVSPEDAMSVVVSDSAMHAVLLDWTLGHDQNHTRARRLLEFVRARNDKIPHLPDGGARRGFVDPDRRDGDGQRVHLDARGHGRIRRADACRQRWGATCRGCCPRWPRR